MGRDQRLRTFAFTTLKESVSERTRRRLSFRWKRSAVSLLLSAMQKLHSGLASLEELVEVVEVDGAERAVFHLGHQPLQLDPEGAGRRHRQHEGHQ